MLLRSTTMKHLEVTMSNNKHECCTPKGQVPRYVDCVGCDKKPIEAATLSYAQAQKDSFSIMENKQSSIEWLENKIDNRDMGEIPMRVYEFIEQAKAMHKEELKESYRQGRTDQQSSSDSFYNRNAESYFNETFGGEK